jgi:predicted transcriptional regulator
MVAKIESGKIDPSYSVVKRILNTLDKMENKEALKAKDVMSKKIIRVNSNDKIKEAIKIMRQKNVSQLPVFDGNNVVGSISERTILGKISAGEDIQKIQAMKISSIMEEAFPRVDKDTPINILTGILHIRPAILITEKEKVVGIITKADLLNIV